MGEGVTIVRPALQGETREKEGAEWTTQGAMVEASVSAWLELNSQVEFMRIIQPEDSHTTLTGSCIAVYDSWSTANPTGRRKTRFVTRKQQVFIPLSILFI